MQSVVQYRRFKASVQRQLERDRALSGSIDPNHGLSSPVPPSNDSKVDLEKGHDGSESSRDAGRPAAQTTSPRANTPDTEKPLDLDEDPEFEGNGLELNQGSATLTQTVTEGTALGKTLSGIEVRRRSAQEGGDGNVFVVGYEGPDDPNDPHNWSLATRMRCTFTIALIGCVVGFASAIDSSAIPQASRDFGVSEVTESLATGLFLAGFGVGCMFAGPISETAGRNVVYIATLTLFMIFELAAALSPNIGAQLAFRFIGGVFGSTPLTCAGGSMSDMWSPTERIFAFPIFANAAFTGPFMGPIIGGFIAQSSLISWRWVDWVTLIIAGLVTTIMVLFQPETYPPLLMKWKAKHLRDLTGDDRFRAPLEIRQETFLQRLRHSLYRPLVLTFREPIIILVALYLTVIYIVMFGFLDGYAYIFERTYGISQGLTGLCFFGIVVGLFGATALVPIIYKRAKRDLAKIKEEGGTQLPPEFSLWYSMLGGAIAIPVSLFWMGWTARPDISIWSPLVASVFFGYGVLCIFISCYLYIIDSYEIYAASALAMVSLIRYVAAGGMTVAGIPFYENEGVAYTLTIFACLATLMVPVPYVFYIYGPWIRKKSKYAVNATINA